MPSSVGGRTLTTAADATEETSPTDTLGPSVVTNEARLIFQWVCYAVLGQFIAVFGIVANIINIICFLKQGFKDPVNISLFGLSISDLCSLLTITWTDICNNPAFSETDWTFDPVELQVLIGSWPHIAFAHVTGWITVFITLERCLCVVLPLKVRTIVTTRRATVINIIIFLVLIICISPVYCVTSYGNKYSPLRNRTVIGLIYMGDRENVEKISQALNNVAVPFSAFIAVIICTIILVLNLKMKSAWRNKTVTSKQSEILLSRDQKLAKMITMISIVFIASFLPACVLVSAILAVPQLAVDGKYVNVLIAVGGVAVVLESTNSSINIFIYYRMSSRYRAAFNRIIVWKKN